MAEINDLNITDASNTARFPENMAPSAVNDGARALEGIVARGIKDAVEGNINSAGTEPTYTVAANRTISAYYDGMRQGFHCHSSNASGAATLNIDSVGAKSIVKRHNLPLVAGDLEANGYYEVVYSASDDTFQLVSPAAQVAAGDMKAAWVGDLTDTVITASDLIVFGDATDSNNQKSDTVQGILDLVGVAALSRYGALTAHNALVVKRASVSTVDIDASAVMVDDGSSNFVVLSSVNLTVDITASGANGLDTGAEATSTWYHLWVIYNGSTTAGLISLTATFGSLTLPSGYTYAGYVGAFYNASGGDIVNFHQINTVAECARQTDLNAGTATTPTSVTLAVPTTATKWRAGALLENLSGSTSDAAAEVTPTSDTSLGRIQLTVNMSNNNDYGLVFDMLLIEAQKAYYDKITGDSVSLYTRGWEF